MPEEDIKTLVEERAAAVASGSETPPPEEQADRFIDQCFADNVMGDAMLFEFIGKGRFLYNGNSGNWFKWSEHFWEEDVSNSILASVGNEVADLYSSRSNDFNEAVKNLEVDGKDPKFIKAKEVRRDAFYKRSFALKGDRAAKVIKWVPSIAPDMVVEADEFDQQHHLLVCKSGAINMELGECIKGYPADKMTLSTQHEWPGTEADEPENFIEAFKCSLAAPHDYQENKEKFLEDRYEYLHRFIGMSCHGAQYERAFMVLFGQHGWNGKGTLMETLLYVLGDYAAVTEPEVLLDSRGIKEAGKPTPHILAMKGKRIIVASETDDGNRFSASAVKRFSGGDTLTGRNPHDIRPTPFKPTHTLFLMTNNLPYTDANDRPFWNRMHLLNFHWSYVDRPSQPYEKPRNPRLEAELRKEAPKILKWIWQGYFKYIQEGGLNPPEEMLKEREVYRFRDDTIGQFLEAHGVDQPDPTAATPFSEIQDKYDPWYTKNVSKKGMSGNMLGRLLGKQFKKTTTKDNLPAYEGIQLKHFMDK